MTAHEDAYPELQRAIRFFPLGVEEPEHLSRAQVQHYNEKGYIAPIDVFDDQQIGEIRSYFDDLLPRAMAPGWNSYELTNWHMHCRGGWDVVTRNRCGRYG